jgi:hypothetical protein
LYKKFIKYIIARRQGTYPGVGVVIGEKMSFSGKFSTENIDLQAFVGGEIPQKHVSPG